MGVKGILLILDVSELFSANTRAVLHKEDRGFFFLSVLISCSVLTIVGQPILSNCNFQRVACNSFVFLQPEVGSLSCRGFGDRGLCDKHTSNWGAVVIEALKKRGCDSCT